MNKGYPIFEWIPGMSIIDQAYNYHTTVINSDDEIESIYSSETKGYITGYEEEERYSKEEEYAE